MLIKQPIMKKLFLLPIILTLFSCESVTNFKGLGGFDIDTKFRSLKTNEPFTKTMEDNYNINSYKLSDEIGLVSDLNVTTKNDKIIEVRFLSNEKTNIAAIEKLCKEVLHTNKKNKIENEWGTVKGYHTFDKNIFFADIEYKNKKLTNGQFQHEYKYSNKEAIKQNHELIMKMNTSR